MSIGFKDTKNQIKCWENWTSYRYLKVKIGKLEKNDGTENTDILKEKNLIKGLYHG